MKKYISKSCQKAIKTQSEEIQHLTQPRIMLKYTCINRKLMKAKTCEGDTHVKIARAFRINTINMLKVLMEMIDNTQNQMDNFSRDKNF